MSRVNGRETDCGLVASDQGCRSKSMSQSKPYAIQLEKLFLAARKGRDGTERGWTGGGTGCRAGTACRRGTVTDNGDAAMLLPQAAAKVRVMNVITL